MAGNLRPARKRLEEKINQAGEYWIDRIPASLGNYAGTVVVPGTTNMVYARLPNGQVVKAFNSIAPAIWDWKVYIGKDKSQPSILKVTEVRWVYNLSQTMVYVLFHHGQHEYPSPDTVWVHRDQFMPLLVLPIGGMHIKLFGDIIYTSGMLFPAKVLTYDDIDLTSYIPVSGAYYVVIEAKSDGTLNYVSGDSYSDLTMLRNNAPIPKPTIGNFPICAIEFYAGQTAIRRDDTERNIIDLRLFSSSVADGGQWNDSSAGTPTASDTLGFWNVIDGILQKITLSDFGTAISPYVTPSDTDLVDIAALTPTNDDLLQRKAGHWTNRSIAQLITDLTSGLSALFAPIAKGVTNGDSHDHAGGDGAQIAYSTLSGLPALESNTNDIFRCDSCGTSGWTGTINGAPSGATVTYTHVSGNQNTLIPTSTSQLAKQRLYNTTRGNYALISNSNGSSTITLTATAPANWQSGDTITTISQTVSGGVGRVWIDLELTSSNLVGKSAIQIYLISADSAAPGTSLATHPFEAFSSSKRTLETSNPTTTVAGTIQGLYKLNNNVITVSWNSGGASSSTVFVREVGWLQ